MGAGGGVTCCGRGRPLVCRHSPRPQPPRQRRARRGAARRSLARPPHQSQDGGEGLGFPSPGPKEPTYTGWLQDDGASPPQPAGGAGWVSGGARILALVRSGPASGRWPLQSTLFARPPVQWALGLLSPGCEPGLRLAPKGEGRSYLGFSALP
ncbi:unnamed protein product [Rangifer tarandus platyrhynchus]|uniref:Uncharacterized protein n=1 Tax=Rangifer tarandus platyrhynchus TaxID=3082113 RepID=A0AC59ZVZ6_RANTA